MLFCLLVGFTISFVFDERRRMESEKERGRCGKERERDAFLPDSTDTGKCRG